jgi:putative ABC transport system permease protein
MTHRGPYRLLLLLFPRGMREAFGDDMHAMFAEQLARTHGLKRARLLMRALADAIRHGMAERFGWGTRRPPRVARRWWMDMFAYDLRYALRTLLRQPGTAAAILLTLAFGIGANTAVFSVVHAVLLRPLPYPDPDNLVIIWERRAAEGVDDNVVSPADFLDWARMNNSFESMAAFSAGTADLTGAGDPVQLPVAGVTAAFFDVLGVRAAIGRTFAKDEDVLGQHRVVVLSHDLWRQRFGADPAIVGRSITVNGIPQQVIGVLPASFEFSESRPAARPGTSDAAQLWTPMVLRGGSSPAPRASHELNVYGRLKPGVSIEAARADMDRLGAELSAQYRENVGHGPNVVPLRNQIVAPARGGLLVVMSGVAFLLLIACTNVANLLLARSAGRRRELAVRSAIGAGRGRLLRQSLTESLLIATLGGMFGLVVASWTIQVLHAETPAVLRGVGLDRARLDFPVLVFTALVCVLTTVVAGALPAWQVARTPPGDPLREAGRSPLSLRRSVRVTLIGAQVALTVLLLLGAGLMVRSFVRVLSQPPGLETASRLVINVTLPRSRYQDPDAVRRTRRAFDERFSSTPGVLAAGASNILPLTGADSRQGVTVDGYRRSADESPVRAHIRIVTPGYFAAAGITLREGRSFSNADTERAPLVIVVNETMARRYWPGQSPLGKRVRLNGAGEPPWREVIGIIGDVRHWGLDRDVSPELYIPHDQLPAAGLSYVLHTATEPLSVVPAVAGHVRAVDADLPLGGVRTFDAVAASSMASRRWSAVLLGMFAVLGLVLAAAGIYGVMTHLVSLRTGEIGIRLTLGARPFAVWRLVLGEALVNTSVGLLIGLAAGGAATRALQSMLYEIAPLDPLTFAGTALVVTLAGGLAAVAPAARAMRVDPVQTLRGS